MPANTARKAPNRVVAVQIDRHIHFSSLPGISGFVSKKVIWEILRDVRLQVIAIQNRLMFEEKRERNQKGVLHFCGIYPHMAQRACIDLCQYGVD